MRKIITTIALAALSSLAIAGTQSANFQATATLNAACTLSMNDFNFGAILFNSDSSKLSQLKVTCNPGVTATGTINTGGSGSFNRYMTDGTPSSDHLQYQIFLPSHSNTSIGDGSAGTETIPITGTGSVTTQWISGVVLRGQYLKPGNYSDSLTLKVTY